VGTTVSGSGGWLGKFVVTERQEEKKPGLKRVQNSQVVNEQVGFLALKGFVGLLPPSGRPVENQSKSGSHTRNVSKSSWTEQGGPQKTKRWTGSLTVRAIP